MLTEKEVLGTLEMLRNEHLDVRTVTLGISLFDLTTHDSARFRDLLTARITGMAASLVDVCNEVGDIYGIPVVNKRISVSPMAVVGAPFSPRELVKAAMTLDGAAREVNVDFIGGFSALVEKGLARGI